LRAPSFTVAVAAYNEEAYVADAIRSVLAQTREDFELIVVDDGSTDRTAEVVASFGSDPRVQLIRQQNRGLARSLNTAIAAGGAPYVGLIDADDLWMPGYLEKMGAALDAAPDAGFAYTDAFWFDQTRNRFFRQSMSEYAGAPSSSPREPEGFLRLLIRRNFVFGLTTMRRAALDDIGGFNETLAACEDYELWIRFLASGYGAVRVPGRLAVQRDRGGSMSKEQRSMFVNVREVCRIAAEDLETSEKVRAGARARIAEMDRNLAALDGRSVTTSAWWAVRRRLGVIRKAALRRRVFYPGTPPDVAAAFPDLGPGEG
jgi:glycosyltransferase involved in cell wall biosynthesis